MKTGTVGFSAIKNQIFEAKSAGMDYVLYHENLQTAVRKELKKQFGDDIKIITSKAELLEYLKTK